MERIVIRVQNKEKARLLFELLRSLDFVEFVERSEQSEMQEQSNGDDFFALAGLWEGRDVTLETIRWSAWPRQPS